MRIGFRDLLDELRTLLREEIRNGEITERGFARRVGVSQSHIHNVLCGTRTLTANTADRLLRGLGISVVELMEHRNQAADRYGEDPNGWRQPRNSTCRAPLPRLSAN